MRSTIEKYQEIISLIEGLNENHHFVSFKDVITIEDSILKPCISTYHLIGNIKDIEGDTTIVMDILKFENYFTRYRLLGLLHRAIDIGANLGELSEKEYYKLLAISDKDILMQLAKSKYITNLFANKIFAYMLKKDMIIHGVFEKLLQNRFIENDTKIGIITEMDRLIKEDEDKYPAINKIIANFRI